MGRLARTMTHDGTYTTKDGKKVDAYIKYMTGKGWLPYNKTTNMPITNTAFPKLADMTQFKTNKTMTKEAATV